MGTRITALDLAMQFRERAEARDGSLMLSAKQVAFLKSLATPVYRGANPGNADVLSGTTHGRPWITAYMPDGSEWTCHVYHNGAGLFRRG